jgi:hypothetical protein
VARLQVGRSAVVQGGARATPEVLKPLHELWTNQNFQDNWVKSIRADLANFKEAVWNLDFDNLSAQEAKIWTDILGLPIPSREDEYKVAIIGLRAVVKYTEWKIAQLERAAISFVEAQQTGQPRSG